MHTLIIAAIILECVGVSCKFSGNMETLEFITTKNSSEKVSFFLQNFKWEDRYLNQLEVSKIMYVSFL